MESKKFAMIIVAKIIILFFLTIWLIIWTDSQNKKIKKQENTHLIIQELEDKIKDLEKKHISLRIEYEQYKRFTSEEFVRTWKSFATVRNNFIALGKGFHLEDEDITPEKELELK